MAQESAIDPSEVALGLVTSGSAGWRTVRERWERDLQDFSPRVHHIEDHARFLTSFTERHGAKSLGQAVAGRRAIGAALGEGARVVLLSTLQNACFAPLRDDVAYIVYGDCTTAQLAEFYGGKTLGFPGSWISRRIQRLADHGCYFLCMSDWYRSALKAEFTIPERQMIHLPFYVDTQRWRPLADKPRGERMQALFIGADFNRKGGDIVYALAARPEFANVDFHVVSPNGPRAPASLANLEVYRSMKAESPALVRLVARSDVFLQPTRADASSLAAMEAGACGVPSIATAIGGIPEIVLQGQTGSLLREPSVAFGRALCRRTGRLCREPRSHRSAGPQRARPHRAQFFQGEPYGEAPRRHRPRGGRNGGAAREFADGYLPSFVRRDPRLVAGGRISSRPLDRV